LQINVASCDIAGAVLEPEYSLCKSTKSITLSNLSTSPLIKTQDWELFNVQGRSIFTSNSPKISYTFPDTGMYTIKLVINRNQACTDSTLSIARVYPGFVPAFTANGACFSKPTNFIDASTTAYGIVDSWRWEFGELSTTEVSSLDRNTTYTYPSMGAKDVRLIVTNSKGCRDTAANQLMIVDKPPLLLAFKDTLICIGDMVQLRSGATGVLTWSPNENRVNGNNGAFTVSPSATTKYFVDLNDNGCVNRDTVLVRVTDRVNIAAMSDTTICSTDTVLLRVDSDAFQYSWTPASQIINPTARNAIAITGTTTTYEVTAKIGGCIAKDQVVVTAVPYPIVTAGTDTTVCFNSPAQLHGTTNAATFRWLPTTSLVNFTTLNPIAKPAGTTTYILSAIDNEGCPKPSMDTVTVIVLPDLLASAGSDTSVIIGQPLQLKASGGVNYLWSPSLGLSSSNIPNPIAVYNEANNGVRYKVVISNEAMCVDSAYITVKVFASGPAIYVPTAFTPNSDGRNDLLIPVTAGIKQIEYFSIYNRWGQRIFTTRTVGDGWNGTVAGLPQATGTYVWMVKATDYTSKPYTQKGTVTLIR
jgi:gliding motility-associated-like protein